MRVAMYYNNRDIRIEELPVPEIGPGELLLRIHACGICGSDVMQWYRITKAPVVLGHEIAAEVVEIGQGVEGYAPGDRVVASHHVPCNTCRLCLRGHHTACDTLRKTRFDPGGFSEFVRLPAINVDRGVYRIPEELSWEEACFAEPLACVLRGQRMAAVTAGDTVTVLGCGVAGLLHVALACALGATRVTAVDVNEDRLETARRFGADAGIHAQDDVSAQIRRINDGRLSDKVLVCTGAKSANETALRLVERGGTVLFFAPTDPGVTIEMSINEVFFGNDIALTTSYAGSPADHVMALDLIRAGRVRVKEMISHRLGLGETARGFRLVEEARDSLKVIIEPQR
ncbi:MAG: alcohol dehydrogenase catalytic domain-containing protein [Deltaproteobacteria bacterium]|nr:alcohol dehydrogenase catalytic domain-containing protein [Deltaproteobacteria bacterium]